MPSIRFRNTWTIFPLTRFGVSITLEMPSLHARASWFSAGCGLADPIAGLASTDKTGPSRCQSGVTSSAVALHPSH